MTNYIDEFTYLRQQGFYGTLEEMQTQAGSVPDLSGNDTAGERLSRARSVADAWDILEVSSATFANTINNGTYVYVNTHGAEPSETFDSSEAIQEAVDELKASSANPFVGGTLCFGKGRYRLTTTIIIEDMSIMIRGVGPAGWAAPGYAQDSYGSVVWWDGDDTEPMFQIHNTIFFGVEDMTIIGNATAGKIPTAVLYFYGDGVGYPNAQMVIRRCVLGRFSSVGNAQRVIYFHNATDAQNDRGIIENCRIDGGTVAGIELTGGQSVLHRIKSCTFGYNAIGIKSAAQISMQDVYFQYSTVRDIELLNAARMVITEFASEQSYEMAKLRGNASLTINGGYWQIGAAANPTFVAIDAVDNSRMRIELKDFLWTAFTGWTAADHPIIQMKGTSNSEYCHKTLHLDNVRYYAVGSTGFTEAFLDCALQGVLDTIIVYGNVQYTSGASLSIGTQKHFYNYLNGNTALALSFDRNDLDMHSQVRNADLIAAGEHVPTREHWGGSSVPPSASGTVMLNYFTAIRTEAITKIKTYTGGTAAGATPTLCRVGVYSVAANGDLTLITGSTNDTAMWGSTYTGYEKTLGATWNKLAGTRYALATLIVTGAALPALVGFVSGGAAPWYDTFLEEPKLCARKTAETDLPASITNASLIGVASRIAMKLVP